VSAVCPNLLPTSLPAGSRGCTDAARNASSSARLYDRGVASSAVRARSSLHDTPMSDVA
jgi:hypothetical protein